MYTIITIRAHCQLNNIRWLGHRYDKEEKKQENIINIVKETKKKHRGHSTQSFEHKAYYNIGTVRFNLNIQVLNNDDMSGQSNDDMCSLVFFSNRIERAHFVLYCHAKPTA